MQRAKIENERSDNGTNSRLTFSSCSQTMNGSRVRPIKTNSRRSGNAKDIVANVLARSPMISLSASVLTVEGRLCKRIVVICIVYTQQFNCFHIRKSTSNGVTEICPILVSNTIPRGGKTFNLVTDNKGIFQGLFVGGRETLVLGQLTHVPIRACKGPSSLCRFTNTIILFSCD